MLAVVLVLFLVVGSLQGTSNLVNIPCINARPLRVLLIPKDHQPLQVKTVNDVGSSASVRIRSALSQTVEVLVSWKRSSFTGFTRTRTYPRAVCIHLATQATGLGLSVFDPAQLRYSPDAFNSDLCGSSVHTCNGVPPSNRQDTGLETHGGNFLQIEGLLPNPSDNKGTQRDGEASISAKVFVGFHIWKLFWVLLDLEVDRWL